MMISIIILDNDGCSDMNSNCEVFLRVTPDLCEKQSVFAYENCQYTCNMCSVERHTVEKREAGENIFVPFSPL